LQAKLEIGIKLQGKKHMIADSFIVYDLGLGVDSQAGGGATVATGVDNTGIYAEITFSFEGIKVKFRFEGKLELSKIKVTRRHNANEKIGSVGYAIEGEAVILNREFKTDKVYLCIFN